MKTLLLFALLVASAGAGLRAEAIPLAGASVAVHPGFVIRAQDRFDPAIQRLMAEHSLRSLPLQYGQLYYLYPIGVTPRLEGLQIRYLESLLDKEAARIAAEEAAAAEEDTAAEEEAQSNQ
ncbi:MAG: hypothetical protein AAGE43_04065 [Pseudomonadota bacterium]